DAGAVIDFRDDLRPALPRANLMLDLGIAVFLDRAVGPGESAQLGGPNQGPGVPAGLLRAELGRMALGTTRRTHIRGRLTGRRIALAIALGAAEGCLGCGPWAIWQEGGAEEAGPFRTPAGVDEPRKLGTSLGRLPGLEQAAGQELADLRRRAAGLLQIRVACQGCG